MARPIQRGGGGQHERDGAGLTALPIPRYPSRSRAWAVRSLLIAARLAELDGDEDESHEFRALAECLERHPVAPADPPSQGALRALPGGRPPPGR
jgi:hypothetical protein